MAERNLSIEQMRMALAVILFSRAQPDPFEAALKGSRRVLALVNLSDRFRLQAKLDPVDPTIPQDWAVGIWIDLTAAFARLRPYLLNDAQGEL
jgi:hypothetical protein